MRSAVSQQVLVGNNSCQGGHQHRVHYALHLPVFSTYTHTHLQLWHVGAPQEGHKLWDDVLLDDLVNGGVALCGE